MYIEITLSKWNGKSTWKSATDIDAIINKFGLGIGATDYYFGNSYLKSKKKYVYYLW